MAIDTAAARSRRALLAGLGASLAAFAAHALGRPVPARSGGVEYVKLGGLNGSNNTTWISNQTTSDTVLRLSHDPGLSLEAFSSSADCVKVGSQPGTALLGSNRSFDKPALAGHSWVLSSPGQTGVFGYSGPMPAPATPRKTGVYGLADQDSASVGVRGTSPTGRGGRFKGKKAALRLEPSSASSHPARGQLGDLFVDASGRLWFCKGGASWRQVA